MNEIFKKRYNRQIVKKRLTIQIYLRTKTQKIHTHFIGDLSVLSCFRWFVVVLKWMHTLINLVRLLCRTYYLHRIYVRDPASNRNWLGCSRTFWNADACVQFRETRSPTIRSYQMITTAPSLSTSLSRLYVWSIRASSLMLPATAFFQASKSFGGLVVVVRI